MSRPTSDQQAGVTLIELLVVLTIMSVVSAMIVLGWSAASRSIEYSQNSAEARDMARVGIDRMTREIRDAQVPSSAYIQSTGLPATTPSFVRTRQTWLVLFTSFNVPGSMPDVSPRVVVYVLYGDGQLWRYADSSGDGKNNGVSDGTTWASSISALAGSMGAQSTEAVQTSTWEGRQLVAPHVVNGIIADPNAGTSTTDLFRYSTYNASGFLTQQSPVLGDTARSGIMAVQIHLLVDLNPGHSPAYIDLLTTAQPRNQRPY
jgi:prepilin-type N-terminal cleavage/methylation domain-containing protein